MDQEQLAEIVKEIEEEQALGRISAVSVFKGMLNQPELVSISSANASPVGPAYSYSNFTVNFPRPILTADTLQLLAANIPLCTQNIPDTACTFWYYRLDPYAGPVPNTDNLFFVRLLPSYYKPEFITAGKYGFNVTFNTYNDVATQLALSCKNDLARDNLAITSGEWGGSSAYQLQFIPSDITLTYNSTQNKFQMTGQNSSAPLFAWSAADTYASGTTYALGAYVTYGENVYRSLMAGNVGNSPATNPTFWAYVTNKLVQDFVAYTPYRTGQYMVSGGTIYISTTNVWSGSPNIGTDWIVPTTTIPYRYLITGYNDPNVLINQNNSYRQWNLYSLFEGGDIIQYQNATYQAIVQNRGFVPFYVPDTTINAYSGSTTYAVGTYVYYTSKWYVCIKATTGNAPTGAYTNNTWWAFIAYDVAKTTYQAGDLVTYNYSNIPFWKCIQSNPPANSINGTAVIYSSAYWIPCFWTPLSSSQFVPVVGLNLLSKQFDMFDTFQGYIQYPFPIGIPGQPFNPAPRRLLNSILGFCWNGVFNVTAVNAVLGTSVSIPNGTTTSDVLNRIRPVPFYTSYGSGSLLTTGQSTTTTTYTADGYANLVYTSVVSIYSTIVYGSTLDSQRNTNLIGLCSMNAGNLGVSFFDNKINGPLRVHGVDLYSVGIELRDEMNEPYPLTNNGIATFTLKLTYKENQETK